MKFNKFLKLPLIREGKNVLSEYLTKGELYEEL
jgi:hypothetical protein